MIVEGLILGYLASCAAALNSAKRLSDDAGGGSYQPSYEPQYDQQYQPQQYEQPHTYQAQAHPSHGGNEVSIPRTGDHFRTNVVINGSRIPMLVDTGASNVSLTHAHARAIGVPLRKLHYNVRCKTAAGTVRAAIFNLRAVTVGGITAHSVEALVHERDNKCDSLLGMSFLERVSVQMAGGQMILRG